MELDIVNTYIEKLKDCNVDFLMQKILTESKLIVLEKTYKELVDNFTNLLEVKTELENNKTDLHNKYNDIVERYHSLSKDYDKVVSEKEVYRNKYENLLDENDNLKAKKK